MTRRSRTSTTPGGVSTDYNAHMAILFWGILIEESPVFNDQQRLKITNAFARQLNHRKDEGVYGLTQPPAGVSSRHGQWSAISLYCLGRYFNKYYPHAVWAQCMKGGELAFRSLHEHAWIVGENDNLYWYSTGIAPVLTYMVLTGDRKPLENGVLAELLRGQEILVSGRVPDWALAYADGSMEQGRLFDRGRPLDHLPRAHRGRHERLPARTIVLARQGNRAEVARRPSGQVEHSAVAPARLGGTRKRHRVEPFFLLRKLSEYGRRHRGLRAVGRLQRRLAQSLPHVRRPAALAGRTILQGYHNQVLTLPREWWSPPWPWTPPCGTATWSARRPPRWAKCPRLALPQLVPHDRRSHRTLRAVVVDDLTFRTDSQNMKVTSTWQTPGGHWDAQAAGDPHPTPPRYISSCALAMSSGGQREAARDNKLDCAVKKGEHCIAFSLIGQTPVNKLQAGPRMRAGWTIIRRR